MPVNMLEGTEASPKNLELPESKHGDVRVANKETILASEIILRAQHGGR
jgi:hypothetical protein